MNGGPVLVASGTKPETANNNRSQYLLKGLPAAVRFIQKNFHLIKSPAKLLPRGFSVFKRLFLKLNY